MKPLRAFCLLFALVACQTANAQSLLVVGYNNALVNKYNSSTGAFVSAAVASGAGGLITPHAVIAGPKNSLLVSSDLGNCVKLYDSNGAFVKDFVPSGYGGLSNAIGMRFGYDGTLLVASAYSNDIKRYDWLTGAYLGSFAIGNGLKTPIGLTFGPNGDLFVVSSGIRTDVPKILEFDGMTGAFVKTFINGSGMNYPRDLTFGPDGNLYVANLAANNVLRFNGKTGAAMGAFAADDGLANSCAFGPDGNLYITESHDNSVRRYNGATGAFMSNIASMNNPDFVRFLPTYGVSDLTGDGLSDLVLQNQTSHLIKVQSLNGTTATSSATVTPTLPANWRVVAVGDFNMDLRNDIVVQNTQTREISILFMNDYGNTVQRSVSVNPTLPAGWQVVCAGDFNGDGWPDLVVQNGQQVSVLTMCGARIIGSASLSQNLAAGWLVVGAADFSGDGKIDLVVQKTSTRQISILTLDGTKVTGSVSLKPALPANWAVAAVGDYDGDGKPDLIVQNGVTGQVSLLTLVSMAITSSKSISPKWGVGWGLVGPK